MLWEVESLVHMVGGGVVKARALCVLGKHSTTKPYLQADSLMSQMMKGKGIRNGN